METGLVLSRLGYKVDTSMLAFQNWEAYHGPDFSEIGPETFLINLQRSEGNGAKLLEVPATAGYFQRNYRICNRLWKLIERRALRHLHLKGLLDRLGVLNKVWLSPETSSCSQMIELTRTLIKRKCRIINMFFHSTALKAGISPFVRTMEEQTAFLTKIDRYLQFVRKCGISAIKLSEASVAK
jgi:hypothetical protein